MQEFSRIVHNGQGLNKDLIPTGMFRYIDNFHILRLGDQQEIGLNSGSSEVGIVILSGRCTVKVGDLEYPDLGSRRGVFAGIPTGLYIPIDENYNIKGQGNVELTICMGKCQKKTQPALIQPEDVKTMQVGKDNWQREVRLIVGESSPSVNLILGETLNPAGNWSGTPAHKHENMNLPHESCHEELYYFRTKKPNGFGIQRLYSPEREIDEFILLKDNTLTFMPWGYHQIVAGPGYDLYYLFFLSGQGKQLTGFVDPEHKWLINQ